VDAGSSITARVHHVAGASGSCPSSCISSCSRRWPPASAWRATERPGTCKTLPPTRSPRQDVYKLPTDARPTHNMSDAAQGDLVRTEHVPDSEAATPDAHRHPRCPVPKPNQDETDCCRRGDQICNDGHLDQRCGKHRSDHCRGAKSMSRSRCWREQAGPSFSGLVCCGSVIAVGTVRQPDARASNGWDSQ
jgi:hypothetical protein